jgi:hypothetical protein
VSLVFVTVILELIQIQELDESLLSTKISLPAVTSLEVRGSITLFNVFDLSNVDELEFVREDSIFMEFEPTSLPSQLVYLILDNVDLNLQSISGRPCSLPNLKELQMYDVKIEGPLRRYLEFPNVVDLTIFRVAFYPPNGNWFTDKRRNRKKAAKFMSDKLFFQGIPNLKKLALERMPLNGEIVSSLQSCPLLEELSMDDCYTDSFMPKFTSKLEDQDYLRHLKVLEIKRSWPNTFDVSYPDFFGRCSAARPGLWLGGNGDENWGSDSDDDLMP